MAPLVNEFKKYPEKFETFVCVTGQHRQMLDQVLSLFEIIPDFDLDIMKPNQDLYDITSRVLLGMRDVLKEVKPDVIFVHGDTTTSTTTALAAFYLQIPVAHIEAGLRTHNIYSPWPEEMNRLITGRLATFHFCPTQLAKENLLRENISEQSLHVTGNTVIDALHWVIANINQSDEMESSIKDEILLSGYNVEQLKDNRKLILITGHRRENFGEGFLNICRSIKKLSQKYPDVDFIYPVHLNPNVRNAIDEIFGANAILNSSSNSNIYLINPLDYLPFVYLMSKSYFLLTDSGGIQEEAPGLGKPVLVMRDTTERPEAVDAGAVLLVGTDSEKIETAVSLLLEDKFTYTAMTKAENPYGDGRAVKRIVEFFLNS
jgi:UDP-N-acetylglucosamine 2-epimerase (non-hydrolysing)